MPQSQLLEKAGLGLMQWRQTNGSSRASLLLLLLLRAAVVGAGLAVEGMHVLLFLLLFHNVEKQTQPRTGILQRDQRTLDDRSARSIA